MKKRRVSGGKPSPRSRGAPEQKRKAPASKRKPAANKKRGSKRISKHRKEGLLPLAWRKIRGLFHMPALLRSRRFYGGALLVVLVCILTLFIYFSTSKNAYSIDVDGETVAIVKMAKNLDIEEIEYQAILKIENQLGTEILVNEEVGFTPVHAKKKEISVPDDAIIKISNALTYKVKAYIITVEGTPMATMKSRKEVDDILAAIVEPYLKEGMKVVKQGFVEEVTTQEAFVESDEIITTDAALRILTATYKSPRTYVIVSGDSLDRIASKAGMSRDELLSINPGYTVNTKLKIGDEMNLTVEVPVISVRTEEEIKYTEVEKKPVQTLNNPDREKSYRRSVQYGSDGTAEVTEHLVRINGIETERIPVDRVIIDPPVPEIIEVGTK